MALEAISKHLLFMKSFTNGVGVVVALSTKCWHHRRSLAIIKSATPCHDAQAVYHARVLNPVRLAVVTATSEDYINAPQHVQLMLVRTKGRERFLFFEIKDTPSLTVNIVPWESRKKILKVVELLLISKVLKLDTSQPKAAPLFALIESLAIVSRNFSWHDNAAYINCYALFCHSQ